MKMGAEECAPLFPEAGSLGTGKVDGAITGHQKPNCLQLPVMSREPAALIDELIGKIVDGMAQQFQRMARLGTYPSFVIPSHLTI